MPTRSSSAAERDQRGAVAEQLAGGAQGDRELKPLAGDVRVQGLQLAQEPLRSHLALLRRTIIRHERCLRGVPLCW
jgi:hypothetical protein